MPKPTRQEIVNWGKGAVVALVAVAVRSLLDPLLGDQLPYLVAFPAMVVAATLWGTGPGLVVAILCAAASATPFLPPDETGTRMPVLVGGFLLTSTIVALVCGQLGGRRHEARLRPTNTNPVPETSLTAWLRTALWGAIVVPAIAFVLVAWWGFERAQQDAYSMAGRASHLALEHARRAFSVAEDIAHHADRAALASDDVLREDRAALQVRLKDMVAGLPAVINLNVWSRDGQMVATTENAFPRPGTNGIADRKYFQLMRDQPVRLGISTAMVGRQSGRELINASVRRSSANGEFKGIISVSLSPQFFRDFYAALLNEQPDLVAFGLIRTDGAILARWPPNSDGRVQVPPDSPSLLAVQGGAASGVVNVEATPGREARFVSFRRVDDYPLYVVASVGRRAAYAVWLRFLGVLGAILGPITAVLVYVSWVALKKTRHEQATSLELQEEIRRRAHAERSMLENQKLETLAVLTGGVAHDFNNLLAIVSTSLHVHRRKHPQLAEDKQILAMSRAVESGVRLTRQLLSFSRKQALKPETISLQSWLPNAEVLLRTSVGSGLSCRIQVEADTAAIRVDVAELELAIINLALNARHASPTGHFELSARNASPDEAASGAPFVVIAARDDGVGIPAEVLPRILEPFFTTRERGVGSGLGLSQVNGLCTQAGGFVRVESTVGAGTTVRLFFPAVAEPTPVEVPAPGAAMESLSGRVLLVEDNQEVASSILVMLQGAGLEVLQAADARSAMNLLQSRQAQPEVVLSDIAMPGGQSGIDLAFAIRHLRPELPVLLTTGYADQLNKAIEGGFVVLPKPVAPERLLEALKAALHSARASGQPPRENAHQPKA